MPERYEPRELTELDVATCQRLMTDAQLSRIALRSGEEILVLPVTHVVHDGAVCFRSAPGTKLGSAAGGVEVLIEIDDYDVAERTGWSVIARGRAHLVIDHDELAPLMALPFEPWADLGREVEWVRVDVDEWSGRRVAAPDR